MNDQSRVRHAENTEATLKISSGGCYEHFQPTPEWVRHDGHELRVFVWTHRTYVAE